MSSSSSYDSDSDDGPPPPGMGNGGMGGGYDAATAEDAALQAPTPARDSNGILLDVVVDAPPFTLDPSSSRNDNGNNITTSSTTTNNEEDDDPLLFSQSITVSGESPRARFILPWEGVYEPRCLSPMLIEGRWYTYPSGVLWEEASKCILGEDDDDDGEQKDAF